MMDKPVTRERLLRILDGQAAKTEATIAGLDEATCDCPARPDGWTAKEVLGHMASGHQGMLALAQGGWMGGVDPGSFDLDRYNEEQRQRSHAMSLSDVLDWLRAARGEVRAYIEALGEAAYQEEVHTPWMGDHPRGKFLLFPALHEGGHRLELERWRASLEAED